MDFRNIFDSFFGFNRNDNNLFENKTHFDKDFNDFESELNRDFQDIFNNFGQMFEILNQFSVFKDINDSNRWPELNTESKSPRDLMLKSNDEIKKDIDLDEDIRQRGLDSIFREKNISSKSNVIRSPIETKSLRKSYFYSSFNNNGRFEEQKITSDEFGNTETLVTKRIGGQTFTQITKRNNKNEIIESKEVVDNLGQKDLDLFKRRFTQNEDLREDSPRNKVTQNNDTNNNSFFKRIFNFWTHS